MYYDKCPMRVVTILGTCLILGASACSKKGDAGWKATVEIVDGMKTVKNPETPRYGSFASDLVEDLSIGDEKDERYAFFGRTTIAVDGVGTIYASDSGKPVQVYDRSGSFVRTLGRQGQGPGEYEFAQGIILDDAGNAYINTGRSLVVYHKKGLYIRNILLKTSLIVSTIGRGGTIIGTTMPTPRDDGGPEHKLLQLSPDGDVLRTLAEFRAYGASPGHLLYHWYTGHIASCLRSAETLFYGFTLEYKIQVIDLEGHPVLWFTKSEKGQAISNEEIELTRKEGISVSYGDKKTAPLGMPDHRPFFSRFLSDDLGRLYVVRFRPITEKDVAVQDIDVFSKDGLYIYRLTWPFLPQAIKGGFMYEVRQDEDAGLTKIIRHRIKNWDDFKAE